MSDLEPTGEPHGPTLRVDMLPVPGGSLAPSAAGPNWALAATLLVLTFGCATTLGAAWFLSTRTDIQTDLFPFLTPDLIAQVWSDPQLLLLGLSFSVPALFILLCHELGHYVACRRYGVPATLPYFLPAPVGFGTFGAFIRIRGALRTRRELFDIGFAGPAAGFAALLPILMWGVAKSTPATIVVLSDDTAAAAAGLMVPGHSLLMQLLAWSFHGSLRPDQVLNLHPFALAAWVGIFATALNLLPLSQLDGSHILYAAVGRLQHRLAWPFWVALAALTFYWEGWGVWAAITLIMRVKHPPLWDELEPLDTKRRWLAITALLMLLLCFMPVPLRLVAVQ